MKKLMIAAAIVCAAAVSQAATINWKTNNMHLSDEEGTHLKAMPDGSTLALVVMSTADGWDTAKDVTSFTAFTINQNDNNTLKGRVTGVTTFTYNGDGDSSSDIVNGNYLALMVRDGSGTAQDPYTYSKFKYVADGKDAIAVWEVSGLLNNSTTIQSTSANIAMTGDFYAAVPEPTSGLLMLLGFAGLALRRRRA